MSQVQHVSTDELRLAIVADDREKAGDAFEKLRRPMIRTVRVRMDRRLAARLDAADIVQEAFVAAWKRIHEFPHQPVSFGVWLRFHVLQKLAELQRRHLGVQARDAGRDVSLFGAGSSSSFELARQIVTDATSPSQVAVRKELRIRLQQALRQLPDRDHEVLTLRFLERLSNLETSQLLGISAPAASNRLVRALERLRVVLHPVSESTVSLR